MVVQGPDGSIGIRSEDYNFNRDESAGFFRNAETNAGHFVADSKGRLTNSGRDPSTGFQVDYHSSPDLVGNFFD